MFGIGLPEMILILAIAIIVIGPKKLPDLAKSLGRAFSEFKEATTEFKEKMEIDNELSKLKDVKKDVKNALDDINDNIKETIDIKAGPRKKVKSLSALSNDKKGKKKGRVRRIS